MIVLDASAAVEWLLRTDAGLKVEARLLVAPTTLHAPHLIDLEVAQALRRLVAIGDVDAETARDALADLSNLALHRHAHGVLLARVWELRAGLTSYDAAYVALAEALGAPIVTCDRKTVSAGGHRARIEVITPSD